MAERVSITTADGVKLIGDWVTSPTTIGAVILLHMMPATRDSWSALQTALAKRGLASIAIDLRGHGESTEMEDGSRVDYKRFSDEEHGSSLLDAAAAFQWLRHRGFAIAQIALGGASFGANLAVQLLTEYPEIAGAALLSPGIEYHGVNALVEAPIILPDQSLWAAASEGDDQSSVDAAKKILDLTTSDRKAFVSLQQAGHGTAMLISHPELVDQMADALLVAIQRG